MSIFGMKADAELRAALRKFAKGNVRKRASQWLFKQGEEAEGLFLLENGELRVSMVNAGGEKVVEEAVEPGCIVGLPATVNGRPYSLSCEVTSDSELVFVSRENLVAFMRQDTGHAIKLLDLLSNEVQAIRAEFGDLKAQSASPSTPSARRS